MFGQPLRLFESVGSTNDVAGEWARAGAPHGAVVRAGEQSAGRGRQGRVWQSPQGLGLYMSLILRPALEMSSVPQLTMVAALAAARTIEKQTGLSTGTKWPNDIVLRGRKIGGILSEAYGRERTEFVIVGMGINVNFRAPDLPPTPKIPASSLLIETGQEWSPDTIGSAWLAEMEEMYGNYTDGQWDALREELMARDMLLGHTVLVETLTESYSGIAECIDHDGVLRVRTPEGLRRVVAGDVRLNSCTES
jgi:BirA family biotin operon repressor/biotin-[acetyl-CoA-carboxylase] ligase